MTPSKLQQRAEKVALKIIPIGGPEARSFVKLRNQIAKALLAFVEEQVSSLESEVASLKKQRDFYQANPYADACYRQARKKALEDAAKIARDVGQSSEDLGLIREASASRAIADAIRSLITKTEDRK